MKKYTLVIDTSDREKTVVGLLFNGRKKVFEEEKNMWSSQAVLPLIDSILKRENIILGDIEEILVNPGPGSFTGLRVGIAIANMLGLLLGKKVNATNYPIEPKYE